MKLRKEFPATGAGRDQWKAQFGTFVAKFAQTHVAARTIQGRLGAVGLFGDFCEQNGHGEFVRWVKRESGTLDKVVVPVLEPATQRMKVPDPEVIAEYMLVMAINDTESRPKGGSIEYRSAWHHATSRAHFLLKPRKHGVGAYADTPFLFVSMEKMKEAIAWFYEQHLTVRRAASNASGWSGACVARGELTVVARCCARAGGRARRVC